MKSTYGTFFLSIKFEKYFLFSWFFLLPGNAGTKRHIWLSSCFTDANRTPTWIEVHPPNQALNLNTLVLKTLWISIASSKDKKTEVSGQWSGFQTDFHGNPAAIQHQTRTRDIKWSCGHTFVWLVHHRVKYGSSWLHIPWIVDRISDYGRWPPPRYMRTCDQWFRDIWTTPRLRGFTNHCSGLFIGNPWSAA